MNLEDLNKMLNSELTTKIKESFITNNELLVSVELINLYSIILFLKTNKECKFRQLIDIVGVDYPNHEKRFKLYYLLLSHENNLRIKISTSFLIDEKISSITKIFPSAYWMVREVNEVRYSEKDKKVIYEPVKLEQNYRDFDFSSPWEGTKYLEEIKSKNKND